MIEAHPVDSDQGTDGDELMSHYFCDCSPERGYCGTPLLSLSESPEIISDDPCDCVVCHDIFESTWCCPVCGDPAPMV